MSGYLSDGGSCGGYTSVNEALNRARRRYNWLRYPNNTPRPLKQNPALAVGHVFVTKGNGRSTLRGSSCRCNRETWRNGCPLSGWPAKNQLTRLQAGRQPKVFGEELLLPFHPLFRAQPPRPTKEEPTCIRGLNLLLGLLNTYKS
jgi:hypothetical protein